MRIQQAPGLGRPAAQARRAGEVEGEQRRTVQPVAEVALLELGLQLVVFSQAQRGGRRTGTGEGRARLALADTASAGRRPPPAAAATGVGCASQEPQRRPPAVRHGESRCAANRGRPHCPPWLSTQRQRMPSGVAMAARVRRLREAGQPRMKASPSCCCSAAAGRPVAGVRRPDSKGSRSSRRGSTVGARGTGEGAASGQPDDHRTVSGGGAPGLKVAASTHVPLHPGTTKPSRPSGARPAGP